MDVLKRIKITSDGTPDGTRVIDMETGKDVGAVFEVDWHMDMHGVTVATIKTYAQIEVEGQGKIIPFCPECRKEWNDERLRRQAEKDDPRKNVLYDTEKPRPYEPLL